MTSEQVESTVESSTSTSPLVGEISVSVSPLSFEQEIHGQSDRPQPYTIDERARTEFWQYIRDECPQYSAEERYPIERLENLLRQDFGIEIKEQLIEYFWRSWSGGAVSSRGVPKSQGLEEEGRALAGVFFEARITGYGSLDLIVAIKGLGKLVKLFDSNLDLFTVFLSAYIPRAFCHTFDSGIKGRLKYAIHVPESTAAQFKPKSVQPAPPARDESPKSDGDRAEKYWLIANFSLVVPVVLALAVLCFAYVGISEERAAIQARYDQITAQETTLFENWQRVVDHADKLEERLIDRLLVELESTDAPVSTSTATPSP